VGCVPGSELRGGTAMEKEKQWKIISIQFVSFLVVIFVSTALAMKYDDYIDYIAWGVIIYAALLVVAAFFMIKKERAT
jgi:hypothetical protein